MLGFALEYKTLVFRKENCLKWKFFKFCLRIILHVFIYIYIYIFVCVCVYTLCIHHGHLTIVSSEAFFGSTIFFRIIS